MRLTILHDTVYQYETPARYCIQCGLVKPDALVEIATVAHIGKPA